MKKALLILFLTIGIFSFSSAQTKKGSWMLDGQTDLFLGNNSTREDHWDPSTHWDWYNTFSFRPGIGYFAVDHMAIGFSPIFRMHWKNSDNWEGSLNKPNIFTYGMGLFSRKYISSSEKLSFFGEFRAEFTKTNLGYVEMSERTISKRINTFEASTNLGMQYLVSESLGILLQSPFLTYTTAKSTDGQNSPDYSTKRSNLDVRLFSSFSLGATFFF